MCDRMRGIWRGTAVMALLWLTLSAPPDTTPAAPSEPPPLRFVRGGLHWARDDAPPALRVNGRAIGGTPVPAGGRHYPVAWQPGEEATIGAGNAGDGSLRLGAPQRPAPLPWLALPWPRQRLVAQGAPDTVQALAFSADGGRLALGSAQGRLAVVDTDDGRIVATLHRPGRVMRALAFSADGALLYAGEQGVEGRLAAYRVGEGSLRPLWHFDAAGELGSSAAAPEDPYAWVRQPGVYRLVRRGGDLLAVVNRSTRSGGSHTVRARLYRLDGESGRIRWRFPAQAPASLLMTWFALDAAGNTLAVPQQLPTGAPLPPDGSGATRVLLLDGRTGELRRQLSPGPLPGQERVVLWRGVGLRPDGARLALALEDGRGLIRSVAGPGGPETTLTLVAPLEIAGQPVTATNGTLAALAEGVVFATGPSYVPVRGGAGLPQGAHPRANHLLGYDWHGQARWAWPLAGDLQGLATSRDGRWLAVLAGQEDAQAAAAFNGVTLLRLAGREAVATLAWRQGLAGRVVYGAVAVSRDGAMVALGEAPRALTGGGASQGRARVWILR